MADDVDGRDAPAAPVAPKPFSGILSLVRRHDGLVIVHDGKLVESENVLAFPTPFHTPAGDAA